MCLQSLKQREEPAYCHRKQRWLQLPRSSFYSSAAACCGGVHVRSLCIRAYCCSYVVHLRCLQGKGALPQLLCRCEFFFEACPVLLL